jgi:hypothetical protein
LKKLNELNTDAARAAAPAHGILAMKFARGILGITVFGLTLTAISSVPAAEETAPLKLVGAIPLPGFTGDFDHFAVDERGSRLFLAGEDHKTVEVFDLKTNRRLKSITGFGTPHSIIYLPETDRILVADGDKGMLQILRGSDYLVVDHVDGLAGADSMKLDASSQILYVVTGGKDVPLDYSLLVAIDLKTNKKAGEVRFESNHVEAFALESSSSRLFVNITDKHEVAVVDRKAMKEIARWPIGTQADNSPMAYDEAHHRLLIVCRKPVKSWRTFPQPSAPTISPLIPKKVAYTCRAARDISRYSNRNHQTSTSYWRKSPRSRARRRACWSRGSLVFLWLFLPARQKQWQKF